MSRAISRSLKKRNYSQTNLKWSSSKCKKMWRSGTQRWNFWKKCCNKKIERSRSSKPNWSLKRSLWISEWRTMSSVSRCLKTHSHRIRVLQAPRTEWRGKRIGRASLLKCLNANKVQKGLLFQDNRKTLTIWMWFYCEMKGTTKSENRRNIIWIRTQFGIIRE